MSNMQRYWFIDAALRHDMQGSPEEKLAADKQALATLQTPLPPHPRLIEHWAHKRSSSSTYPHIPLISIHITLCFFAIILGTLGSVGIFNSDDTDVFLAFLWLILIPGIFFITTMVSLFCGQAGWLGQILKKLSRKNSSQQSSPWLRLWHCDNLVLATLGQRLGICILCGMALGLGGRITFSDVRCSWDSSLPNQAQSERIEQWTAVLAAPWKNVWPEAVPSPTLIQQTGPLRSADTAPTAQRWWPFLLLCFLCYALLPRLVVAGLSQWWLNNRLRNWVWQDPYVLAIDARLRQQWQGWAQKVATTSHVQRVSVPESNATPHMPHAAVHVWQDIPITHTTISQLTGPWAETIHICDDMNQDLPADCPALIVLAEAWEAPGKGFLYHLNQWRTQLGSAAPLLILLIDGNEDAWQAPNNEDVHMWQRYLQQIQDPQLRIEPLT